MVEVLLLLGWMPCQPPLDALPTSALVSLHETVEAVEAAQDDGMVDKLSAGGLVTRHPTDSLSTIPALVAASLRQLPPPLHRPPQPSLCT